MQTMSETNSSLLLTKVLADEELTKRVKSCRLLLVGAGGIGSEVLKDLLLMGFQSINVIDLDTIDVSNLNRQFLFNKQYVGKSKAETAAKVAVDLFGHDSAVDVQAIHNSIQKPEFGVDFYKGFTLVINALDNRAARSHVNRMCLAADVPLIESGSEGYMGQVFLIKKGVTQCYECEGPKQDSKTYASCTIRNTPSLPIHCIVWAKHLFAQLFGEVDADNDVSPDANDPELGTNGNESKTNGSTRPKSTRDWAQDCDYDCRQLFDKLFKADIEYLLTMEKLWENRRKPDPISYDQIMSKTIELEVEGSSQSTAVVNGNGADLKEQRVWTGIECLNIFEQSINELKNKLKTSSEKSLFWDKDDEPSLDFVTAVSNFRSHCFHINRKSKFDVKSMAGNIIPAISSTNSIVGGLITLQCLNVLRNLIQTDKTKEELDQSLYDSCRHSYLRKVGPSAKNLISSYELPKPNAKCLVCSANVPEIEISLNISETTLVSDFVEQIVINKLHFVCPDVQIDGTANIVFSQEDYNDSKDEERQRLQKKALSDCGFKDSTRLKVYDLIQDLTIIITLRDEKIDPNENDGLFYKLVITHKTMDGMDGSNDSITDEPKAESNGESNQMEVKEKSDTIEGNAENVTQITLEDDSDVERAPEMDVSEQRDGRNVEEVTISDDSDSEPEIIDDDSVDIIEVREKRKIDSESSEESVENVPKRHKN